MQAGAIARNLNMNAPTVWRILQQPCTPTRAYHKGRRVIDTPTKKNMAAYATQDSENRAKSWSEIGFDLHCTATTRTIQRAMHKEGLYRFKACSEPYLT